MIRWTTVFLDRPAATVAATCEFWKSATATTMSSTRGEHDEFSTFLPTAGDPHIRLQRIGDGPAGSHFDLHVDDVRAAAVDAVRLGATEVADLDGVIVLLSPGGLTFCFVAHHGESARSGPIGETGARTLVDQVCIDIAPDRFDLECDFWAALTGWVREDGRQAEFRLLVRPVGMPLRFLLQRRGEADRGFDADCHLDLACDDVAAAVKAHVALGAVIVEQHAWWTVMADPTGVRYCLTGRSPDTGRSASR